MTCVPAAAPLTGMTAASVRARAENTHMAEIATKSGSAVQWERAEIARSSVEARLTLDASLRVSADTVRRYIKPSPNTAYPKEYSFHLLGDVSGQRVVDFGCGSGGNTVLLTRRGAHVYGLDISEDLIRLARRRLLVSGRQNEAAFIVGSAHDAPFPDASIDVVFGNAILHHLNLELAAREVLRILKPGGRAIFQEPVRNSAFIRFIRSLIPYQAPAVSPYERPLTDTEIVDFARDFSHVTVQAFCLPHVQVGRVLPLVRRAWRQLYALDSLLLRRAPALSHYASIRVISLTK